jgi:hypothetical protein
MAGVELPTYLGEMVNKTKVGTDTADTGSTNKGAGA